jgi:hypothetical protein
LVVRLSVNLDPDLYALAKALAKAEDCSLSAAVNRLLRRALLDPSRPGSDACRPGTRNDFVVSRGRAPVTADLVREMDALDDAG